MKTSPFAENKDTTYDWLERLRADAFAGKLSIEDLLAMLKEKPMVYIVVLCVVSDLKVKYTQKLHEKIIDAMERYEQRQDIKDVLYNMTKKLLKNGKA